MRLLRKIGDYPLRVYDWFILWLSAAVHRWLDAKTIAEAVEPPPSRAQQALDALNTRIEQSMQASRILGLIGNLANRWENLSSAAKICCGAVVAFATGATSLWWCGEPLKLNFTAPLHTLVSGLGFLFVAMVAANLLIAALFFILLALSLPLHLWRLAEMISGFLMRHVLPQGVVWRYTWWRLRRTGRRRLCSALVDSEKVTPLTITLSDGTFQYAAEVIKENGRYFYRVEDITVEIMKYDYGQVIVNPRLYYFSTALKLHFVVERIKKAARDYTTCKVFKTIRRSSLSILLMEGW